MRLIWGSPELEEFLARPLPSTTSTASAIAWASLTIGMLGAAVLVAVLSR